MWNKEKRNDDMKNILKTTAGRRRRSLTLKACHCALAAALLSACTGSDDDLRLAAGSAAQAVPGAALAMTIATGEDTWQGHTVALTRAGETLNALKASTARSWDFAQMTAADRAALEADVTNWTWNSGDGRYSNNNAFKGAVTAGGVELALTRGLTFKLSGDNNIGASNFHIRPGQDLQMGGTNQVLTIPALKRGQEVTIVFQSANSESNRQLTPTNLSGTTGFSSTNARQTGKGTVTADGDVTFTTTDGAINLYSITVSREESDGFGLYSTRLGLANQQVLWETDAAAWNYGSTLLWPDNVVKYSAMFNGKDSLSKAPYFSFSGNHNFNAKFNGCTYHGFTYTRGLKIESDTQIKWTSGANENKTKVTIVQSRWGNKTIKFDNVELDSTDAKICTIVPGGRIYTLRDVAPGNHSITRGNGESGIFYVSVDIDFLAYAPYQPSPTYADGKLSFTCSASNTTDLLWANDSVSTDGTVHLNFRHALGRLSFGTITNSYGHDITLTKITFTGQRYPSGKLSLADGSWSGNVLGTESSNEMAKDIAIAAGSTVSIPVTDIMQIPGESRLKVKFTFTSDTYGTEEIETPYITFEQGKNKTINAVIGMHHEVEVR